ncbi:class I SAM-dependent methyltransferase [Leptolyngbya sp. KIOST-1]|uniref:class I SAM-dependent methyltransferase n=1 Tax=Leptolyngbya sp. KIOST-1 TaxID=1229172 RepID=UPI000907D8DD|nr:class I SAM-dependent methyltransferase [Leptolyngbya sp. KIOST-1]
MSEEELVVNDDDVDFYGKQYWLNHQNQDLGFPDIFARTRNDLTERNLHWLKILMKYRLPSSDVLELGCSHGSFVALMQQAGYCAAGVEMSPWVVSFGKETFDVPIYLGPVENLDLAEGSLDVIALMDVLEHLPDPEATLKHCSRLLKPDGFFLIQTPDFKEDLSYQTLRDNDSSFLEQLKADEHLFLFSQRSVSQLLNQIGFEHIHFEPAIFSGYDMCFVAGRESFTVHSVDEREKSLLSNLSGRMVLALLDIRERELALTEQLTACDADRIDKLSQISNLSDWLKQTKASLQETQALLEAAQYKMSNPLTKASIKISSLCDRVLRKLLKE